MKRRPDESMNLLNVIRETALEPAYRAREGSGEHRMSWLSGVTAVLVGLMFAISALQSTASTPQNAQERAELIARIRQVKAEQDQRYGKLSKLEAGNKQLRERLITDPAIASELAGLEPVVGHQAVQGPGVVIVVDDADNASQASDRVNDRDLRQLVNGLWQARAEAIAINGHRLSTRTAIRNAGAAITVDYTSLTRPYKIEAIGDSKTLPAAFAQTSGAAWWNLLQSNYGLHYELRTATDLSLNADPGLGTQRAEVIDKEQR